MNRTRAGQTASLLLLSAFGVLVAAPAWGAARRGEREELSEKEAILRSAGVELPKDLPLDYVWSLPLERPIVRDALWPRRDLVLALVRGNTLYCIRRRDGVPLWAAELIDAPRYDPVVTDQGVYLVIRNHIVCIDRRVGEIIWRLEPRFTASAAPRVAEPNLYIPAWDRRVHAVEVRSHMRTYVHGRTEKDTLRGREYYLEPRWHVNTGGHILSVPCLYGGLLYFGSEDGYLYAVTQDGESVYRSQTQGPIRGRVTATERGVYAGSSDFNAYGFDRLTGGVRWVLPAGSDVLDPVYVDERLGVAVVVSHGQGVYGVEDSPSAQMKSAAWHLADGLYVAGIGHERVYVRLTENRLAGVEKASGLVRWMSLMDGIKSVAVCPPEETRAGAAARLLIVTDKDQLICLKEPGEAFRRALEEMKKAPPKPLGPPAKKEAAE